MEAFVDERFRFLSLAMGAESSESESEASTGAFFSDHLTAGDHCFGAAKVNEYVGAVIFALL